MNERSVLTLARSQHGLVTRAQAQDLGVSPQALRTAVGSGRWERVRHGVYVVGAAPSTWQQRVLAACLAAGDDAMASHRTAARLAAVVDRSGRIELLTDGYRRLRLPGISVHRTIHLADEDRVVVDGIPATSLVRTLIDVAPGQSEATVGRWVDLAVMRNQLDLSALARRTNELTMPGRPIPLPLMRALAQRSPGYDPGRSALEARILDALGRRGIPLPERQHPVTRPDGRKAFIDLSYPPLLVAIEADGWETHGVRSAFESDRVRANELALLGWTVYRFTWSMTDGYICDTVARALGLTS